MKTCSEISDTKIVTYPSFISTGDIVVFDNRRVMHAREAFNASQRRELESWYSEWDPIYSGIRLARITKNLAPSNLRNGH